MGGALGSESAQLQTDIDPVEPDWTGAWRDRSLLASLLVTATVVGRFGLSVLVVAACGRAIPPPHGAGPIALWWIGLAGVSYVVLETSERLTRRLTPLSTLLRLSLAFPNAAPSRFSVAFRAGSTRELEQRIDRARTVGLGQQPAESAVALLDLVAALSDHDRATRGHSERVRAYTELIAEELGLPEEERNRLRWGGLVHDVGKTLTPTEILNKTSPLTEEEWEIIKRHPLDGLALAAPLRPWLGEHVLAVSDHHERYDGGGYPSGVGGNDISLAGRMVAVADAFDVMTSARSYKKPMSVNDARQELVACAGGQFDPEVVRAFLAVSMRRLRAVLGPLGSLFPLVALQFRVVRVPHLRLASAVAAVTLAGGVLSPMVVADSTRRPDIAATAPVAPLPRVSGANGAHEAMGGETLVMPDSTVRVATGSGRDGSGAGPSGGGLPDAGDPSGAAPPGNTGGGTSPQPPEGGGSTPGGSDTGTGPEPDPTFTIVIDPARGAVSIKGSDLMPGETPVLDQQLVGAVACGAAGVCRAIEIPVPLVP